MKFIIDLFSPQGNLGRQYRNSLIFLKEIAHGCDEASISERRFVVIDEMEGETLLEKPVKPAFIYFEDGGYILAASDKDGNIYLGSRLLFYLEENGELELGKALLRYLTAGVREGMGFSLEDAVRKRVITQEERESLETLVDDIAKRNELVYRCNQRMVKAYEYQQEDCLQRAVVLAHENVEAMPQAVAYRLQFAPLLNMVGGRAKALSILKETLALDPTNPITLSYLIEMTLEDSHLSKGEILEVIVYLETLNTIYPSEENLQFLNQLKILAEYTQDVGNEEFHEETFADWEGLLVRLSELQRQDREVFGVIHQLDDRFVLEWAVGSLTHVFRTDAEFAYPDLIRWHSHPYGISFDDIPSFADLFTFLLSAPMRDIITTTKYHIELTKIDAEPGALSDIARVIFYMILDEMSNLNPRLKQLLDLLGYFIDNEDSFSDFIAGMIAKHTAGMNKFRYSDVHNWISFAELIGIKVKLYDKEGKPAALPSHLSITYVDTIRTAHEKIRDEIVDRVSSWFLLLFNQVEGTAIVIDRSDENHEQFERFKESIENGSLYGSIQYESRICIPIFGKGYC